MAAHGPPHRSGDGAHVVAPVCGGLRRQLRLGHDGADDQCLQCLAVLDVVVERHRAGPQRLGKAAHAERRQPIAVDDGERGLAQLSVGEFLQWWHESLLTTYIVRIYPFHDVHHT